MGVDYLWHDVDTRVAVADSAFEAVRSDVNRYDREAWIYLLVGHQVIRPAPRALALIGTMVGPSQRSLHLVIHCKVCHVAVIWVRQPYGDRA